MALINLDPTGSLRFALPRIFLRFETFFYTGERQEHERPKLNTVIIEPDFPRVSLVWHSALPCYPKVYKLEKTRITLKPLVSMGTTDAVPDEEAA